MNSTVKSNIRALAFKDYYPIHESWLPEIFNYTGTMLDFRILDQKSHFYFSPPMINSSTITIGLKWKDLMIKYKTPRHCGFPLANPHSVESLHIVPDENIGKNLEELCIRRSNLKYLDREKVVLI